MAKVPGVTSEILKKKVLEALEGIGIKASDIMGKGTNVKRITSGKDINPFKPNMLQAMRGADKTMGDALDAFANEAKYIMNANDGELVNFLNNLNSYKSIGGAPVYLGAVSDQGVGSMMKAMTDLEKAAKDLKTSADEGAELAKQEMKKILEHQAYGGPFKVPDEKFLGGSMHEEGQLRTGIRQFLQTELNAGRLKLNDLDTNRVRQYSGLTEHDPILVFKRTYGEDAYKKAGTFPGAFEIGEDFKHYEKIFRDNMGDEFLKIQNKENIGDGTLVLDESFKYREPPPDDGDIPFNQGGRVGLFKGTGKKGLETLAKKADDLLFKETEDLVTYTGDPERLPHQGDWPGMESYYKEEVGPATDRAIGRALKDFQEYRNLVENTKGRGNRESRKKRRAREIKTFKEWIDKLGVGQYFYKDGGRVGMVKGSGKKGVGSLIKLVDDKFGEGTLKTADDIARPEAAVEDEATRELFQDFNMKLTTEDLMKAAEPKMAGPILTKNKKFFDPESTDHTAFLLQEEFFRPDAKDFLGQKVPSNWIAIERKKAKDTLKELGPLPSRRHPNWEDMRKIRQGVKNRLVALDITEELGGNVAMFDFLRIQRGMGDQFLDINNYIKKEDAHVVKDELSGINKAFMTGDENLDYDWVETPEGWVKKPGSEGAFARFGKENKELIDKGIKTLSPLDELRKEFPGISDELALNILADDNPQRIAEVKATLHEAMKMEKKGMAAEDIINIFKNMKRTKNAAGGGVGSMFRGV